MMKDLTPPPPPPRNVKHLPSHGSNPAQRPILRPPAGREGNKSLPGTFAKESHFTVSETRNASIPVICAKAETITEKNSRTVSDWYEIPPAQPSGYQSF